MGTGMLSEDVDFTYSIAHGPAHTSTRIPEFKTSMASLKGLLNGENCIAWQELRGGCMTIQVWKLGISSAWAWRFGI